MNNFNTHAGIRPNVYFDLTPARSVGVRVLDKDGAELVHLALGASSMSHGAFVRNLADTAAGRRGINVLHHFIFHAHHFHTFATAKTVFGLFACFEVAHFCLVKGAQVAGGAVLVFHNLYQFAVKSDNGTYANIACICHKYKF